MDLPDPLDVDLAWRTVITHAWLEHWQWGTEIMFTYGPLGFLHHPVNWPGTLWVTFGYQAVKAGGYLFLLSRVAAGLPSAGYRGLFCLAAVVFPALDADAAQMLMALFTGICLGGRARRDQLAGWLGVLLAVPAAHGKPTFLLLGGLVLALVAVQLVLEKRGWWLALLPGAVYVAGYILTWMWPGGQALENLPVYLYYAWHMVSGHSEGMGLPAIPYRLALGVAASLAAVALYYIELRQARDHWRGWPMALAAMVTLFLAWKQGFARGDVPHTIAFFAVALVLITMALAASAHRWRPLAPARSVFWGGLAVLVALSLVCGLPVAELPRKMGEKAAWMARQILQPGQASREWEAFAASRALPEIRGMVGGETVDLLGYRDSVVLLNGLNYRPAPVFQAYLTYTRPLLELNRAHYRSGRAARFLIIRLTALESKMPLADYSRVLPEILRNYVPVHEEEGYLLLRRVERKAVELRPLAEGTIRSGQLVEMPVSDKALWCELTFRETLAGKLHKLALYRPRPFLDIVLPLAKRRDQYLVTPFSAEGGFPLAPQLRTASALYSLYDPGQSPGREPVILGFQLSPLHQWLIQPVAEYRVYELDLALDETQHAEELRQVRELKRRLSTPLGN